MDSILMTFAIPNGNPNATALAGNQAGRRQRFTVWRHREIQTGKTYFRPLDAHPQIYVFRFQVLCICRGRFFLSVWWKYFARISTSYRTRPRDDAPEAKVDLTPLR